MIRFTTKTIVLASEPGMNLNMMKIREQFLSRGEIPFKFITNREEIAPMVAQMPPDSKIYGVILILYYLDIHHD